MKQIIKIMIGSIIAPIFLLSSTWVWVFLRYQPTTSIGRWNTIVGKQTIKILKGKW